MGTPPVMPPSHWMPPPNDGDPFGRHAAMWLFHFSVERLALKFKLNCILDIQICLLFSAHQIGKLRPSPPTQNSNLAKIQLTNVVSFWRQGKKVESKVIYICDVLLLVVALGREKRKNRQETIHL